MYNKNLNLDKTPGDLSFEALVSIFVGFYIAGTDTTTKMAQMMVLYLATNKRCWEKVKEEVSTYIKTDADITS